MCWLPVAVSKGRRTAHVHHSRDILFGPTTMQEVVVVVTGVLVTLWLLRFIVGLLGNTPANDLSRIPSPRKAPVIGHLKDLLDESYHKTLTSWASEFGNIYKLNVLGLEGLVVCDPTIIGQILGQERGITELPKLAAYQQLDMVSLQRTYSDFDANGLSRALSVQLDCNSWPANFSLVFVAAVVQQC